MSATIKANGLKFVIFASGHDYTLADSGDGDVQIFSHPFVPLNSVNYAGQYYFLVPDENGNPLDAVKDDRSHCTFTPALGTAFSTEGETTVEVHYHREYIYDEETLVVDKTVSQKITVVNHGSVVDSTNNLDVYSDGYGFIRPLTVNGVEVKDYSITGKDAVTKLSSIPWRATGLGAGGIYGFFSSSNLTDISELAFADTSKCTKFTNLFAGDRSLVDISAVENWDTSNVVSMTSLVIYTSINSLKPFAKWNTSKVTDLDLAFAYFIGTKLDGLENWDVSHVTNMRQIFDHNENLTDASAIANWDVSKVTNMEHAFSYTKLRNADAFALWNVAVLHDMTGFLKGCPLLVNLSGLSNWVGEIYNIEEAFAICDSLVDISGVHGLDVSHVTNFTAVFAFSTYIVSLDGLEDWDVSNGQTFYRMFRGDPWIADISAIANWDLSHATQLGEMFGGCAWVTDISMLTNWRINTQNVGGMFTDGHACYSSLIGERLWYNAYYYFDYEDNQYTNVVVQDEDHPLTYPTCDATVASQWGIRGSHLHAFDDRWIHKPSWN